MKYKPPLPVFWENDELVEDVWWSKDKEAVLSPEAFRKDAKLKTADVAIGGPEFDDEQRAEYGPLRKAEGNRIWQDGSVEKEEPGESQVSKDFYDNTIDMKLDDGRNVRVQQNTQTGMYEEILPPSNDTATKEEKEVESRMKQLDIKSKFIQQLGKETDAEGNQRHNLEDIEATAERIFGDKPADKVKREVVDTIKSILPGDHPFLAQMMGDHLTKAEEAAANGAVGAIRRRWDEKREMWVAHPDDAAKAQKLLDELAGQKEQEKQWIARARALMGERDDDKNLKYLTFGEAMKAAVLETTEAERQMNEMFPPPKYSHLTDPGKENYIEQENKMAVPTFTDVDAWRASFKSLPRDKVVVADYDYKKANGQTGHARAAYDMSKPITKPDGKKGFTKLKVYAAQPTESENANMAGMPVGEKIVMKSGGRYKVFQKQSDGGWDTVQ